jgi:hypothetical protein
MRVGCVNQNIEGKNKNFRRWQNESYGAVAESKTTHAAMGITEASVPLFGGNESPGMAMVKTKSENEDMLQQRVDPKTEL